MLPLWALWGLLAYEPLQMDSVQVDSIKTDTLQEVVISSGPTYVKESVRKTLETKGKQPKVKSFGEVLEQILPGVNDRITHPFAIKERRKERRKKKAKKILRHYDQVKTPNELLLDAIEKERLRESSAKAE